MLHSHTLWVGLYIGFENGAFGHFSRILSLPSKFNRDSPSKPNARFGKSGFPWCEGKFTTIKQRFYEQDCEDRGLSVRLQDMIDATSSVSGRHRGSKIV